MTSPAASRKVASSATRGRSVRNPPITPAATANAPAPLTRITASADRPGGVASAAMGSESMASPLLFLDRLRDRRRLGPHHRPARPLHPLPREHPLLRN